MKEAIQKKISDSPAARWTALVLLASAMFFGYIFMDILSPLQELLQVQRGWDPVAYGRYAGSETFLNVFVFFLIFAGIILDKMGVRFTAILSGAVMLCGASINYFAVSDMFIGSGIEKFMQNALNLPNAWWNVTPFHEGMPASAKMSAIGFMLFGCGVEMAGITVSRGIVKWFKGKEMALAMGVEMAIARIGVAVVVLGAPVAANIVPVSVSRPVAIAVLLLLIGLISFIVYAFMGMYDSLWRYAEIVEFFRFCVASFLAVGAFIIISQIIYTERRIPIAVYLMGAMFASILTLVARLAYRMYRNTKIKSSHSQRRRVLLIGAGDAAD